MKTPYCTKKSVSRLILTTIIAIILMTVFTACGSDLAASTMRLLRREGTVRLYENDKERTISDNLRLNAGNILNTESKSLAGIALDDSKIVTIDELSSAQFDQSGKKLDINLTKGSLFFEVTKKLDSDESFDIRTSTMVVGIRGTSGYVTVDDAGHEALIITDGSVEVKGTNPTTGETKTVVVNAGQRVRTYLYNDRSVDSIMFEVDELTEEDLNLFVLERLRENYALVELVCADTGWSVDKIMGVDSTDTMLASNTDSSEEQTPDSAVSEVTTDDAINNDQTITAPLDDVADESTAEATAETAGKTGVLQYVVSTDSNGVMTLTTGQHFDPAYYARENPDVVSEIGTDSYKLLEHFLAYGESENRYGSASDKDTAEAEKNQEYLEWQKVLGEAQARDAAEERARNSQGNDSGSSSGGATNANANANAGGGGTPAPEGGEPTYP